ncbi:hypothetical protein JCM5296_000726 [Sporobolomyces johnsonii]
MPTPRPCPPPLDTLCLSCTTSIPTKRRPRSRTLSELDDAKFSHTGSSTAGFSGALGWPGFGSSVGRWRNESSSSMELATGAGGNASDSAYATMEDDDELDVGGDSDGLDWREKVAESLKARSRRRMQMALGGPSALRSRSDGGGRTWSTSDNTTPLSPGTLQAGDFPFDVDYDLGTSFDSLESLNSPSTPLSTTASSSSSSSRRSSPESSECEFDGRAWTMATARDKRRKVLGQTANRKDTALGLARRHTLPRRSKVRSASISVSFVAPKRIRASSPPPPAPSNSAPSSSLPALPPLTQCAMSLAALVSIYSFISSMPIAHISPVHLLHPQSHLRLLVDVTNAALSPFLVSPSAPALALGLANFELLRSLDERSRLSWATKAGVAAAAWAGTIATRVAASHLFGRLMGWQCPHMFSTRAIHETGYGFAPLLLVLFILHTFSSRSAPSYLHLAILGASFFTPVEQGGAGLWLGLSAAAVGLVGCIALAAFSTSSTSSPTTPSVASSRSAPSKRYSASLAPLLALLLLPTLARYAVPPSPSSASTAASFAQLHPEYSHLLTVLLMTAPRPGNPDFLLQTIESWLGAFPDPALDNLAYPANSSSGLPMTAPSSRIRLIVYTHFSSHPQFDLAQSTFTSPRASHYLTFHRDPRAYAADNRLDQRLHVARGLDYAAREGNGAYVLLTEDDFPLCEDDPSPIRGEKSWRGSWDKLQAALVKTNELLPDDDSSPTPGHCGLFLSTGGSGLAIRTPIASLLPSLLLGSHDPHGYDREARAARGEPEYLLKREGEGADTPDLVIQDCLRGRLPECAMCAPAPAGGARKGSARMPWGLRGDRYGKSGLAGTERLLQRHLGYNTSTLPGRRYGKEEWACGWRQPFNGEPDVLTV